MYHSVTFGSKNSYSDWHLVPDSRPVIAMPKVKTNYIEIPGASGKMDLSETLTKYPLYDTRTGDMKFHVLNGYEPWQMIYHKIANYIHGKRSTIILEDDPNYQYEGRIWINSWESNKDGTWSDITFGYELDPYKYSITNYKKTKETGTAALNLTFNDSSLGRMPVVPSFTVRNIGATAISIKLVNPELGITNLVKEISSNGTHMFYDLILSKVDESNACSLTISGSGYVEVQYRKGDL